MCWQLESPGGAGGGCDGDERVIVCIEDPGRQGSVLTEDSNEQEWIRGLSECEWVRSRTCLRVQEPGTSAKARIRIP